VRPVRPRKIGTRTAGAVLAAALAFGVAACGGDDGAAPDGEQVADGADSGDGEGAEAGDDGEGEETVRTTTTIDPETLPPLERLYLNQDPDAWQEQAKEVEEKTAVCMRGLGWQYTPVDQSQYSYEGPIVDEDEYREQWGYGITTFIGREDENPYNVGPEQEFVDPNSDYVSSLSESEQNAFYEDLYGVWSDEAGLEEGPVEPEVEGCQTKASNEVYGDQVWQDEDMSERLNGMYEEMYDNPQVDALYEEWAACMVAEGFDQFETPDDVWSYFDEKSMELQGIDPGEFGDVTTVFGRLGRSASLPEDGGEGGFEEGPSTTVDPDELKRVQEEELAVAKADFECQEEHVREQLLAIQIEIQQRFIDENPDIYEAMRRQAEGTG
jgi:hypothetical protein